MGSNDKGNLTDKQQRAIEALVKFKGARDMDRTIAEASKATRIPRPEIIQWVTNDGAFVAALAAATAQVEEETLRRWVDGIEDKLIYLASHILNEAISPKIRIVYIKGFRRLAGLSTKVAPPNLDEIEARVEQQLKVEAASEAGSQ